MIEMSAPSLCMLTAVGLAHAIVARTVSPAEAAEPSPRSIEETGPHLELFVPVDAQRAMAEALRAQEMTPGAARRTPVEPRTEI